MSPSLHCPACNGQDVTCSRCRELKSSYNPHQACLRCGSEMHSFCGGGEQGLTANEVEVLRLRSELAKAFIERDEITASLRETVEALESSFPGDDSVGLTEFPEVDLSEAWSRRLRAREALAKFQTKEAP